MRAALNVALIATLSSLSIASLGQDAAGTIEVTARGESEAPVSKIHLRFKVTARGDVASEAIERFTAARTRGAKAFESLELDGLEVGFHGPTVTRQAPAPDPFAGFQPNQQQVGKKVTLSGNLVVSLPIAEDLEPAEALARTGEIIDAGLDAGLDTEGEAMNQQLAMLMAIYGRAVEQEDEVPPLLSVSVADPEALEAAAYESAIASARRKAAKLAALTGVSITGVRSTVVEKTTIEPSSEQLTRARSTASLRIVFATKAN